MNLLSVFPSVIGKIGDLVDRDVTSNIEVHQEALFPLMQFHHPTRVGLAPSTNLLSISAALSSHVAQPANTAQTFVDLAVLDKGVWDLVIRTQYTANFTDMTNTGWQLILQDMTTFSFLLIDQLVPTTQTLTTMLEKRITIDRNDLRLRFALGLTGVGQTQEFNSVLYLGKAF